MCGISGLHLRDPELHPRLGELLRGMMCQAAERGPDAAGVGVYGDPTLTPPGCATVTVLDETLPEGVRLDDAILVPAGVPVAEVRRFGQVTLISAAGPWRPSKARSARCSPG
jgi:glutamate synthase domain-containing protein 1